MENLFIHLRNRIALLQHDFVEKSGVPVSAINFVLNSAKFRELSYLLIKTGFKCGFSWCFAFNIHYKQLAA